MRLQGPELRRHRIVAHRLQQHRSSPSALALLAIMAAHCDSARAETERELDKGEAGATLLNASALTMRLLLKRRVNDRVVNALIRQCPHALDAVA